MKASDVLFLEEAVPGLFSGEAEKSYLGVVIWGAPELCEKVAKIFPHSKRPQDFSESNRQQWISRYFRLGVSNPLSSSLSAVLGIPDSQIRVDRLLKFSHVVNPDLLKKAQNFWREPAIEEVKSLSLSEWLKSWSVRPEIPQREDDSFGCPQAHEIALEFEGPELAALEAEAKRRGRPFNRAELELFAQTWSEHCKHKIFNAEIECPGALNPHTKSLFKTHIRAPSMKAVEERPGRYLSLFHDNAGVIGLDSESGEPTEWAMCLKMETHNSPSAIAPYGGASTGVVGVHRDILGTGLGALPIANWDVLCFESPDHKEPRPTTALLPELIRSGVLKGVQDGGNQSGIPTVQGSVVFDPNFAVKPFVFAGCVGLLPKKFVDKKALPKDRLYCVGGATGADGLRGAVMSSRDIRSDDFAGSIVQVANAFVQRRMTDFLLEARNQGLISSITDNGAGGLASSCGEMAQSTHGARIDLSNLRLKFSGLLGWERLVSESQERMTVATRNPQAFEEMARRYEVEFDELGELNDSGRFEVLYQGKHLVDLDLDFLHKGCPDLKLQSKWTLSLEEKELAAERPTFSRDFDLKADFLLMLDSPQLCSREAVIRRFDHEVQGRTLRKPFAGLSQSCPQDGSLLEIYENTSSPLSLTLAHGLSPQRKSVEENVLHSFDEAIRSAVLAGARFESAGLLDNFSWADPMKNDRRLWRLTRACEILSELSLAYGIPFVSGKDSMKNNSKDFAAPETLVVSIGASSLPRETLPSGYFSRPNDVLVLLPARGNSMKDSAWEKVFQARSTLADAELLKEKTIAARHQEIIKLTAELKDRYLKLSKFIERGAIRGAKDISEGGLLMALFEMSLGRKLGAVLEYSSKEYLELFGEGLGGIVLSLDPHWSNEICQAFPEAQRIGVVYKPFSLRFTNNEDWDLRAFEEAYLKKGREGFWA